MTCWKGCCPRAAAILEEAEPDALAYLDFPPSHWKRLRTNNVQVAHAAETQAQVEGGAGVPLDGIAGGWQELSCASRTRCGRSPGIFSEAKMGELYDEGRARGIDGTGSLAAAGGRGQEDDRIRTRACGQGPGGIGYQPCSDIEDPAHSLRIGRYTNFLYITDLPGKVREAAVFKVKLSMSLSSNLQPG